MTRLVPVFLEGLPSLFLWSFVRGIGVFLNPTGALYRPDSLAEKTHHSLEGEGSVLRTSIWRLAQHLGGIIFDEARLTAVHRSVSLPSLR